MRVLLTTQPGAGHWRPLAPLAFTLQDAGHEVTFATTPIHAAIIKRHGLPSFPVGRDDTDSGAGNTAQPARPEQADEIYPRLFAGIRARDYLLGLLQISAGWNPDLIIRETSEFAGCLAAELLGIPHVAVQVSAWRQHLQQLVAAPLNALCAADLAT